MKDQAQKLVEEAQDLRNANELLEAGDVYTAAAHEYAGTVVEHLFPEPDNTRGAVSRFRYAATCYRIGGDEFRTQNRCDLGVLLAEDYVNYIDDMDFEKGSFADLRRGAWPEFIGDLRVIAQRDEANEAYDRAISIYESAGDFEFAYAEQEHMRLAAFFRNVRRGLGHDIPEDAPEQMGFETTFSEWLEYKRSRLPDLLNDLEAQGTWPVE